MRASAMEKLRKNAFKKAANYSKWLDCRRHGGAPAPPLSDW
jgi:hypothetical protein